MNILANGLCQSTSVAKPRIDHSWVEIDRLSEFFNLQVNTRRTSSIDAANTALTASVFYSADLKEFIERAFGEHTESAPPPDVADDVRNLSFQIHSSNF
jgi:hypothetical protein